MGRPLSYTVAAPPEQVLESIARSVSRSSWIGFSFADRGSTRLVGGLGREPRTFSFRRARGFLTPPRVVVLRGRVEPTLEGARVNARYAYHPLVQATRIGWLAFFVLVAAVSSLAAAREPGIWLFVAIIGVWSLLLQLPFEYAAHGDRAALRVELERILRHAGSVSDEAGRLSSVPPAKS